MVDQGIVDYIKTSRASGYNDEQIYSYLISQGYQKELLDEAFESLKPKTIPTKSILMVGLGLAFGIVLFMILGIVFTSPECIEHADCEDGISSTVDRCVSYEEEPLCVNSNKNAIDFHFKTFNIKELKAIHGVYGSTDFLLRYVDSTSDSIELIIFDGVGSFKVPFSKSKEVDIDYVVEDQEGDILIEAINSTHIKVRSLAEDKNVYLTLALAKNEYSLNENITGVLKASFRSSYESDFLILKKYSFESETEILSHSEMEVKSLGDFKESMYAFGFDSNSDMYKSDSFKVAGVFTYDYSIYSCAQIRNKFSISCSDVSEKKLKEIPPLKQSTFYVSVE